MNGATHLLPPRHTIHRLPGWLGGWLCLGLGALAVVIAFVVHGNHMLVALHGTPTEGMVLTVDSRRPPRGSYVHSVTLQYRTSTGAIVEAQTRIPEAERIRVSIMQSMRSPVELWSVPYAPWAVRLRTTATPPLPDWDMMLLLAAGLAALGIGTPFFWGRHAMARASLERAGRFDAPCRAAAIITHTGYWQGGADWARAVWRDETGEEGCSLPRVRDSLPKPGSCVLLRIDPASGKAWWEGEFTRT